MCVSYITHIINLTGPEIQKADIIFFERFLLHTILFQGNFLNLGKILKFNKLSALVIIMHRGVSMMPGKMFGTK